MNTKETKLNIIHAGQKAVDELIKVEDMPRKHLEHAFIKYCPDKMTFIKEKQFKVGIVFDITDDSIEELHRKILLIVKTSHTPSLGDKILENLDIREVE